MKDKRLYVVMNLESYKSYVFTTQIDACGIVKIHPETLRRYINAGLPYLNKKWAISSVDSVTVSARRSLLGKIHMKKLRDNLSK